MEIRLQVKIQCYFRKGVITFLGSFVNHSLDSLQLAWPHTPRFTELHQVSELRAIKTTTTTEEKTNKQENSNVFWLEFGVHYNFEEGNSCVPEIITGDRGACGGNGVGRQATLQWSLLGKI